jgi:pimeloyl-ACP methyl ester carboxylesterase
MAEETDRERRQFLRTAALAVFAGSLGWSEGMEGRALQPRPRTSTQKGPSSPGSFGPVEQIDAGVLDVGYAHAGPRDGRLVVLLHGWPYDIHCYAEVAPLLTAAGYRVIVPYLRGHGTTRFLSRDTLRNGQQAAIALDIVALMDALGIEQAILGGCDWGARTANIIGALWPERCRAMVLVSGYLIGSRELNRKPLPPQAELQWWYQYWRCPPTGCSAVPSSRATSCSGNRSLRPVWLRIGASVLASLVLRTRGPRTPRTACRRARWPISNRTAALWSGGGFEERHPVELRRLRIRLADGLAPSAGRT